ncbi:MAG: CoA transferase [SAR202 cluster bacterium]|nr:CoA transferase [SAR202 cluster bacterium]
MPPPLEGIKVLDLSRLAPGPFCTMILGDLGADVLRIEEPGGGAMEAARPRLQDPAAVQRAAAFNAVNRNKRSIALNLKHPEARAILHQLSRTADVLVEGFRPGVVKRLGCDYDTLRAINPRLIYCGLSGYGQTGPYNGLVGHDLNYISFAGMLGLIGPADGPPAIPINVIADMAGGGMHAAVGILAAVIARGKSGQGQYVDAAMLDGVFSMVHGVVSAYLSSGRVPVRGKDSLSGGVPQYNVYECADGKFLAIAALEPHFWRALCTSLGREDFIPRQNDEAQREEQFAFFRATFKTRTRDEWFDFLSKAGDTAVAKVLSVDEVVSDPQVRARGLVAEVGAVNGETVRHPGVPHKLSATPGSVRRLGPVRGQHTDEVLRELGLAPDRIKALREQGALE